MLTLYSCWIYLVAVPTPITEDKKCDLSYVKSAMETVSKVLSENNLVILESTVRPKTTIDIVKPILDATKISYDLAYVSEKAIPGNTIHEMIHNDRINIFLWFGSVNGYKFTIQTGCL